MAPKRLTLLGVGLAALGTAAAAVLVGPCSADTPGPAAEAPPQSRAGAVPRARGGRSKSNGRSGTRAPADEPLGDTGAGPAAPDPTAARVRVRVTRDGRPVEGVAVWVQPLAPGEDGPDVPATQWSDGAYFGVPRHLGLAESFDPAPTWAAVRARLGEASGRTGRDGTADLPARPGAACAVVVASDDGSLLVGAVPVVRPAAGAPVEVALSARPAATIEGRCLAEDGSPVVGAMVQAFDARAESAASALVRTGADGAFALTVDGSERSLRVRAAAPRGLQMCDSEAALPPVLEDTAVEGVVPGGAPLDVRLRRATSVVLELTSDVPFGHLQVEELVLDPAAQVWGRLGGPVYGRDVAQAADPRRAFVALARADAQRPLMLWTWGGPPELTGVDPRGRTRVAAHLARGRKVTATGKGWLSGDRIRVVCRIGPAGEEFPAVWVENGVGANSTWSRDDTPPCAIEFRLVRDGREIGPRPRVPAGGEDASVRLDL